MREYRQVEDCKSGATEFEADHGIRLRAGRAVNSHEMLDGVRSILLDELAHARIFLFGSWADGRHRRSSDIDIAVIGLSGFDRRRISRAREKLEESRIPYRVEIVDLADVDPTFRENVLTSAISWND